jgi:hypothetical protein
LYSELVVAVMSALFFGTSKRLGIIYMDELLQDDKPENLEITFAAAATLGGEETTTIPTIVDCSPEAKRGPSLAALAFAGISVWFRLLLNLP